MKQLVPIVKNQFRCVLQTLTVKIWIGIVIVYLLILVVTLDVDTFKNGFIWSLWGNEDILIYELILPMSTKLLIIIGFFVFFPIGLSDNAGVLIQTSFVNYCLSRPVSRATYIFGHLIGIFMAYMIFAGIFVTLIILILGLKSGIYYHVFILKQILYVPLAWNMHALLLFLVLTTRSKGAGSVAVLVYYFGLSQLLNKRTNGGNWGEKLTNITLDGLSHVLPPVVDISTIVTEQVNGSAHLYQSLFIAILSTFVLSIAAVIVYRRMEF